MSYAKDKVEYIVEMVPRAALDQKLLILTYWRVFDGINIPPSVAKEILEKGTSPETISRSKRKIIEQMRRSQREKVGSPRGAN